MCAFLVAAVYLGVQLRYRVESLSVFIFPAGLRHGAGRHPGIP
jgi:hypothetical protein